MVSRKFAKIVVYVIIATMVVSTLVMTAGFFY